jgi:hypothetical protein
LHQDVIEENFLGAIQQLVHELNRNHRGLYAMCSGWEVEHVRGTRSHHSFDEEVLYIKFMKFAPLAVVHEELIVVQV